MISYEVTLQVDPALAPGVEEYTRSRHIPAIWATGCFSQIRFARASSARFRTCYQAESQDDLDRYLQDHAPRFRVEFLADFPQGVTVTRETWVERQVWSS
jgi:hypothetical protein